MSKSTKGDEFNRPFSNRPASIREETAHKNPGGPQENKISSTRPLSIKTWLPRSYPDRIRCVISCTTESSTILTSREDCDVIIVRCKDTVDHRIEALVRKYRTEGIPDYIVPRLSVRGDRLDNMQSHKVGASTDTAGTSSKIKNQA